MIVYKGEGECWM